MIHFISHNNIQSDVLELAVLSKLESCADFLYLTATQNLKAIRTSSPLLSTRLMPFKENFERSNLFSVTEFIQCTSKQVYASKEYISVADQKYILTKVIQYYYFDNKSKLQMMLEMRYDLFELYKLLLFHNKKVNNEQLTEIINNYSNVEADIFSIFSLYEDILHKTLRYIMDGVHDELLKTVLGTDFLKEKHQKSVMLFSEKQKEIIETFLSKRQALIFDGFLFFNEVQRYMLSSAIKQSIPVYFVSKQFADNTGAFIFERNIKELAKELKTDIAITALPQENSTPKTALEHVKRLFPIKSKTSLDNKLLTDGSILFMKPFISREEELRFIAKDISALLRNNFNGNTAQITEMVSNDIAIVLAIDKENYEERISNIFREVGLFVFDKEKAKNSQYTAIDVASFDEVYFNKNDFVNTEIKLTDGSVLCYQDKHDFFESCFMRIDINRNTRPIASYPIGQFILELYKMVAEGITVEGFKNILYSNWRYTVDRTEYKWSDFISDFKYIDFYFQDGLSVDKWLSTAKKLVALKSTIQSNLLYQYHPLRQIKDESLNLFCALLSELDELTKQISNVVGSISSHLNTLKSVVIKADQILGSEEDNLEFEQLIIKRLVSAISDIGTSSIVNNLDAIYFANNLKSMLTDWETQNQSEVENTIKLNVVNLENMKQYKYCYFMMCEANKYPRKYFERFPYTKDIVDILKSEKYGIEVSPHEIKGLEYHLELERYLFKNVLDFTTEKITFTQTEKDFSGSNTPSIFTIDVAAIFGVEIPYSNYTTTAQEAEPVFINTAKPLYFNKKERYTLTELAIFKLCPKLYYHLQVDGNEGVYLSRLQLKFYFEAILYCDVFKHFMEYNLENKKVYSKHSNEHVKIMNEMLSSSVEENAPLFSFFTQYEIDDSVRNVAGKIMGFIDNAKDNLKGDNYTVITYKDKHYDGTGYELVIEHDNRVVDYDIKTWRMSQNKNYLQFLVLKTSDNKSQLSHYNQMIDALDKNIASEDRVNLTTRIIAKINIQFDSKRFAHDGLVRTDELVDQICSYDFSKAEIKPSEYCSYCRFNDICMMN